MSIKNHFMWCLLLFFCLNLRAQSAAPPEWKTDFDAAVEEAYNSETQKFVFVLFTGSDWCLPCMQLKNQVLEKEAFLEFARQRLVLVKVDFPRLEMNKLPRWQEKYNESLAREYNPDHIFPLIAIVNEHEELLGTLFY
ncbi:MAG: thioredoxin family protein, partial [Bacteroidetes bacterium]